MIRRLIFWFFCRVGRWRYRHDPDGSRCYLCPADSEDAFMVAVPLCGPHLPDIPEENG